MPKVKKQDLSAEESTSAESAKKKTTAKKTPKAEASDTPAKKTTPRQTRAASAKKGSVTPPQATETALNNSLDIQTAAPGRASEGKGGTGPLETAAEPKQAGKKPAKAKAGAPSQDQDAQAAKASAKAAPKPGRKAAAKATDKAPDQAAEAAPAQPEPARAEAPATAKKRSSKAKAEPATSTEPSKATTPKAPQKAASTKAAAPRRGRKAAAETAPEDAGKEVAAPQPANAIKAAADAPAAVQAGAEPVLLEVPKRTSRRKKEAAVEALAGVEVLPTPENTPAPAQAEAPEAPARQQPSANQKAKRPARSGKTRAAVPSRGVEVVPAESAEPVVDTAQPAPAPSPEPEAEDTQATPEQTLITAQLRKLGRPVHVRDLERTFTRQALERVGGWRRLTELLEDLVESGAVIRTRKKTYGLPEAMNLVRGRFQSSQAGFGFVIPDSGGEDYYIPEGRTMETWNGDIVLVRPEGRGDTRDNRGGRRGQKGDGNPRASVVRIVQRAYRQLVGTLEFSHGHPILRPDDHRARHRILLLPEGLSGLEAGARVVTELYWPENTGEDEVFGKIVRVLGAEDDPETETEAVIVKYGLRGEFPAEVEAQAAAIPAQIPPEALQGRLDLRSFNIFTVDGRDAKDFDDAIHIQPTPEGTFVVGIHIADVSHYVREGTPLDQEAYARATSVYLPGRVLPMLPEHLSNGVCSLVPYEDRLTMTALVELSAEGDILKVQLAPSVINSKARLTYDEVQAYSEATATLPEQARQLEGDLHLLLKMTTKLRQKRLREGSLDFKLREVKVDVGPDGRMELIPIREETARGMIEDLMLLANKVVAHYLLEREIPTLFRIHEEPTLQRFQEVTGAIGRLGLAFPGGEPTPQAYQAVLKQVRGSGRESVVNTLLLRSMQQAKYAGENLGHFGLAFDEYLHFTSPIRRYPDLVVHRTLKHVLAGDWKAGSREVAQFQGRLPGMGEHTSDAERKAAEAERDLTKYYQCKWAQEHLGESFTGSVSGVVASGLYVALDNGVEGKLHISYLDDDYYVYLEDAQMLKGRRTGQSFRLGDSVKVTIQDVKPLARQIDLVRADPQDPDYREGSTDTAPQNQEKSPMDQPVKPRARRREEREAEHREKLAAIPVSAPKKFTLDDDSPAIQSSPQTPQRQGGYTRAGRRQERGPQERGGQERGSNGRSAGPTFGGVSMNGRGHSQGARGPRRVITLERPRNEHLRPVNITVQRMYFGDWTLDNLPPDEGPTQARAGRERGYSRSERGERSGSSGRGWTRGGSDRGAVQSLNGRPQGRPQQATQAQAQQAQSQATQRPEAAAGAGTGDEAKRRRRRRGRRPSGGNGNAE